MNNRPAKFRLFSFLAMSLLTGSVCHLFAEFYDVEQEMFFEVKKQSEVDLFDQKIIFKRVAPPDLPVRPAAERSKASEFTEEEKAAMAASAAKEQISLLIEAREYEPGITSLRWRHDGTPFLAWTNADFMVFPGFGQIETEDLRLTFMLLATKAKRENHQSESIPEADDFDPTRADYFVVSADGAETPFDQAALRGIEAVHVHYEDHEEQLRSHQAAREVETIERARDLAENPPLPKDTIIHFWPIRTRTND